MSDSVWEFREFRLDSRNQVLSRQGVPIKLAPQPFKALDFIVSRRGDLVTREEVRRALWGSDDVNVDFEHGLNTCLRQIRTALGETGREARIVETVPRVGYRLLVPARLVVVTANTRSRSRLVRLVAAAASVVLIAGIESDRRLPSRRPFTSGLDAHELYVRGRVALDKRTETDIDLARRLFVQAAERAPESAAMQAGIALTYVSPPDISGVPAHEAVARATEAVHKAALLAGDAPDVRVADAMVKLAAGNWSEAERTFKRALLDNPDNVAAHHDYAIALSLFGRFDESLHEGRRSVELDPLSPANLTTVGDTLRFARRYDEAMVLAEAALRLDPTFTPALHLRGLCYEARGDFDRAIDFYRREGPPTGNLGHAYARAGREAEARALLANFEAKYQESGFGAARIAQIYVGLRENEKAFEWLERMAAEESNRPSTLKVADVWDPLRNDPRFQVLLRKMGLAE